MNPPSFKTYLGDSVYAEVEHGMIKLTTNNGYPDDPRNVIYLEPEVYVALIKWNERVSLSHYLKNNLD